jgi:hypothetical protein
MRYDVTLRLRLDDESERDAVSSHIDEAPFEVVVLDADDISLTLRCFGIEASGNNAMPEVLRRAQVGISSALRHNVPTMSERGGLLWSDIMSAEVETTD